MKRGSLGPSPVVLPVGDVELHVAVLAGVAFQPCGFTADLAQNAKHQLLCGHGSIEDADALLVGYARVSPCPDESIAQTSVASNVG